MDFSSPQSGAGRSNADDATKPAKATFRDMYCQKTRCQPDRFEREVFWRCFPPLLIPAAKLVAFVFPSYFEADYQVIKYCAAARSPREVKVEVETYSEHCRRRGGFVRRSLRFRLSGKRMLALTNDIMRHRSD